MIMRIEKLKMKPKKKNENNSLEDRRSASDSGEEDAIV